MRQIRQLQAGDPIPTGEPKRYLNGQGYVRLRWRVGPQQTVECYEHRIVAGVVAGERVHVHHKNHQKDDNRPGNLEVLNPTKHAQHHRPITWSRAEAVRLYQEGLTTTEVALRLSVDGPRVSRALKAAGVPTRPSGAWKVIPIDHDQFRASHARGDRLAAIARHLGVSRIVAERVRRQLNLPPFPVGRPRA